MEHTYDDIVLLERYLEKSLTSEEAHRVEERLAAEPALKELFNQEKMLVQGIRYGHLKSRLESLRSLESTLPAVEAKVVSFATYWKPMAAAAVLVLSLVSYLVLNRTVMPVDLYAQYYEPYPNVFEPVVRGQEANEQMQVFAAYERHDYRKAADGFKKMLEGTPEKRDIPGIVLLLGNANLMLGKTQEAEQNFITLSKQFDSQDPKSKTFLILSKWYLSLCYLKMDKKPAARALLEELAADGGSKQEKAKELLRKLN